MVPPLGTKAPSTATTTWPPEIFLMLSTELTPKYIPTPKNWVFHPAKVTVLPELLAVAAKVKVVLPPVEPAVFCERVTVNADGDTELTVVPAGKVKLPAVLVVMAAVIPGTMPLTEARVKTLVPLAAAAATEETLAGIAQNFVIS